MTRVTSEGSSRTRYVNPRRSKGTSCLDGIENVHWVFLLTVYILTLAGPDFFLRALVSIGRGGLDLRDFGVYSSLLSSSFGAHEALFATLWFQIQHQIIVYYYAEVPQSLKLVVVRVICDILNVKA